MSTHAGLYGKKLGNRVVVSSRCLALKGPGYDDEAPLGLSKVSPHRCLHFNTGSGYDENAHLGLDYVPRSWLEGCVSYWQMYYHVVWGTKHRAHLIDEGRENLIRSSLLSIAIEQDAILRAIGIMPDHVHVVVSIPPKIAVADFIGRMKGVSSRRVNAATGTATDGFGWQPEYGVFTFGHRALEDVVSYVENQREIHTKRSLIRASFERFDAPIIQS